MARLLRRQLAQLLQAVYEDFHQSEYLGSDPLVMVHGFDDPADREIAALFAALLAYGNVKQINTSLERLFQAMDGRPGRFVRQFSMDQAQHQLAGFKHRFADENDILCLCWLLHQLLKEQSLEEGFARGVREDEPDLALAAGRFVDLLQSYAFAPHFDRPTMLARSSFKHLVPRADKGSACKRIHLFLRWMIRPADGIDLGLWPSIPTAKLLVPVDTHLLKIGQNLGFTKRATASLEASRDITRALRRYCADDPVRFDFSLCRLGILRQGVTRADFLNYYSERCTEVTIDV